MSQFSISLQNISKTGEGMGDLVSVRLFQTYMYYCMQIKIIFVKFYFNKIFQPCNNLKIADIKSANAMLYKCIFFLTVKNTGTLHKAM